MSRRGSIKKESNGTWSFVVDVATGSRRHQIRRRGFPTRREAQAALNATLADQQRGEFVPRATLTVGDYLRDWMTSLDSTGRRIATVSSYRHNLRLHVLPHIGETRLQELSPFELDGLYRRLLAEGRRKGTGGLSNRTVRYIHTIVAAALKDAVSKGLLARSPATGASPPSARSARPPETEWWRPADLRAFLDFTADHEFAALFRLAGATGMRRGELVGLRWSDVDLDAHRIIVRRQVTSTDYVVREGDPKSERGRRLVTIDSGTVSVLRHLSRSASGIVFRGAGDRPVHPESVGRVFSRLVATSGLPRIRFHDLRHSHVAHLIEAGVDPLTISRRLGHASVAFTLDRYGHLFDEAGANAARAVGDLIGGVGESAPRPAEASDNPTENDRPPTAE